MKFQNKCARILWKIFSFNANYFLRVKYSLNAQFMCVCVWERARTRANVSIGVGIGIAAMHFECMQ